MRITDVRAVYPRYKHVVPSWRSHLWQIVVRVDSDAGVVGYGYGGGGLAAVEVVNRHLRELLIGASLESVAHIGATWDTLYAASIPYGRKGIGIMALSGVDLALWDLLGQAERRPVYDLIGRRSKGRVTAYATGSDPEWYRELGFTAHKFSHRWSGDPADYDIAVQRAARARELFGADARIMIDTYMSWDAEVTLEMARLLRDYDLYWFEDVLTPDELQAQAALRPAVKPTLLAGGEHEFTHYGFQEVARAGALDLWQPDITWCGGITAGLRILELARAEGIPVAPHRGHEVWALHLIVSSDCMDLAEVNQGMRGAPRDELWVGEPRTQDGYIEPSDAPGFGVTPNEAML
jgi:L-rhamnonate dehydratase